MTGDAWSTVGTGSAATCAEEGEDAVVARLADAARGAMATHGGVASVGVGIPGLYDPDLGTTEFLVNFPGGWRGVPVVGSPRGLARAAHRPHQRCPCLRSRRAPAGCGTRRGQHDRAHPRHRRGRGGRGPWPGAPRLQGQGGRAGASDHRPGRAMVQLRESRLCRGLLSRRPDRHRRAAPGASRRRSTRRAPGIDGPSTDSPTPADTWASGSPT